MFNKLNIVPRWIIFVLDIFTAIFAFTLANIIYYSFDFAFINTSEFAIRLIYVISVTASSFYLFKMHTGIIRYTSAVDSIRILTAIVFAVFVF